MTDMQLVALALAAFLGALQPTDIVPYPLILACTLAAYVARRPPLLILLVAILCSTLAARSWAGIDVVRTGTIDSPATVVTDPVRHGGRTTAVIRVDGFRTVANGWGRSGAMLGRSTVGDHIQVQGRIGEFRGSDERKAALHVGTRLSLESVEFVTPPNALFRLANSIRAHISGGAASLSDERRALLTGLVYGDDRDQSPVVEADFRLAGLTHLLAVSGQNVAYVVALCGPAIRRLSLRGRWLATVAILVTFATVTRFEPSVLRATVMAGLAVTGNTLGREASGPRLLAMAVTVLLLIDPLLASTVAFQLSVAASGGIAWLRPLFLGRSDTARWPKLREAFAVTLAAQLGVAPVLILVFGPVSLISLPANILAGPVAAITMTWGMTAGLAAGVAPTSVAWVIHLPTNILLAILEGIARTAAQVPLAPVGLGWITVALLTSGAWRLAKRAGLVRVMAAATWLALAAALVPAATDGIHEVGPTSQVWVARDRAVLILSDTRATTWLLDDMRSLQIRRVDVVVVADRALSGPQIEQLRQRLTLHQVVVVTDTPTAIRVDDISVPIDEVEDRLVFVEIALG